MQSQRIGELNGRWAKLFKLSLLVFTLVVMPLSTWAVVTLYSLQRDVAVIREQMWTRNEQYTYATEAATRLQGKADRSDLFPHWQSELLRKGAEEDEAQNHRLTVLETRAGL